MLAGGEKFEIIALLQNRTIVGGNVQTNRWSVSCLIARAA